MELCGYCGSALKINELGRCNYCSASIDIVNVTIEEYTTYDIAYPQYEHIPAKHNVINIDVTQFSELIDNFITSEYGSMMLHGEPMVGKTLLLVDIVNKLVETGKNILFICDKRSYTTMLEKIDNRIHLISHDDIYLYLKNGKYDLIIFDDFGLYIDCSDIKSLPLRSRMINKLIINDFQKVSPTIFSSHHEYGSSTRYSCNYSIVLKRDKSDKFKRIIKVERWPYILPYEFEISNVVEIMQ